MPSIINATTTNGVAVSGDNSGELQLATNNGTTAVTITTSQNVGVGTNSPTVYGSYRTLEVRSAGGGLLQLGTGASTAAYLFQDGTNSGFNNISNGVMTFGTNNTERMRITAGGGLLIGQTTGGERIGVTGTATNYAIRVNGANTSGTFFQIAFCAGFGGAEVGNITSTGSATTYATSSDYRLKENITPMTGALAKVSQLKPVTYKWKVDGSDGQGFIAHELQEIIPDAVVGKKDAVNDEGKPVYQGVDTSFLVATLTAAIQELNAKVEAQAAEIAALKGAQ